MIYLDNLMTPGVYEKEAKNIRDKAVEALTKTGFVVSQEIAVSPEMLSASPQRSAPGLTTILIGHTSGNLPTDIPLP